MVSPLALFIFAAQVTAPPLAPQPLTGSSEAPAQVTLGTEDLAAIEAALGADTAAKAEAQAPVRQVSKSSMNPDISAILDVAGAYFSDDEPLQAGAHDPTETGFNFQQLELSLLSNVDPYFQFKGYLLFGLTGVEVEEVYATTLALPHNLQLRFGQFLTRFGRFNATHPHSWYFADQMLVHGKFFGGEGNRGLGVEASYLAPLPWYVELIASTTDARGAGTARSFWGAEDAEIEDFGDFQYTAALKQFFPLSEDWSLNWGLSGAFGPNATGFDNRTDIYGTDVFLRWRPVSKGEGYTSVSLEAEYLLRRRQVPSDLLIDRGGYAFLAWRFAQRWETGVRYEQVTGLKNDPLDPEWDEKRTRTGGQVTFYPTEFSRLRLQVNQDRPSWREPYWGAFLATEISVGAHGAHIF
jgi:hypothetical protein